MFSRRRFLATTTGAAAAVVSPAIAQETEGQVVVRTTGGAFEAALKKNFFDPFSKATGIKIVPVAASYGEMMARSTAMIGAGSVEWDIISPQFYELSKLQNLLTDLGDCSEGGSSDWIKSCQSEVKLLEHESGTNGCVALFDDYYACASASFTCEGATASFPGCDAKRAALDACFGKAEATTSCRELATKQSPCSGVDAGGPLPSVPPACTLARDCAARCFLDHASNACAPRVDELQDVASCTAHYREYDSILAGDAQNAADAARIARSTVLATEPTAEIALVYASIGRCIE